MMIDPRAREKAVSELDFGARETVGTSAEGDGRDESEDGSRPGEVSSFPSFSFFVGGVFPDSPRRKRCCCCLRIIIVILQDFRPSHYSLF